MDVFSMSFLKWITATLAFAFSISSHAALLEIEESDSIVYMLNDQQQILTYDLMSAEQGSTLTLANPASHFTVTGSGIITANNRELRLVSLDGQETTYIGGTSANIRGISVQDDIIITLEADDYIRSYTSSGALIGGRSFSGVTINATTLSNSSALYSSNTYLYKIGLNDSGLPTFSSHRYGTSDYGEISKIKQLDATSYLLSNGYIFDQSLGKLTGRLPMSLLGTAARIDSNILVLDSLELIQYKSTGEKVGTYTIDESPQYLTSYQGDFVGLRLTDVTISATYLNPESDIQAVASLPAAPDVPELGNYAPEKVLVTKSGEVILYDQETSGIFVWSLQSNDYVRNYFIGNDVIDIVYDEFSENVFSIHSNGYLTKLDVSNTDAQVETIAFMPGMVHKAVSVFESMIYIKGYSWDLHRIAQDGQFLSVFGTQSSDLLPAVWDQVSSAHFALDRTYLRKYSEDTISFTLSTLSNFNVDVLSEKRFTILPEINTIALSSGKLLSTEGLTNYRNLSSDIYDAAYPAAQLTTINSDKTALQFWSNTGELTQIIPQGNPDDIRLVYDETYLGVVKIIDNSINFARYNISTPVDTDLDEIADIYDNCPNISNADQADSDGDYIGDLCDSDIDGDGIPNSTEVDANLDPYDASDRNGDIDNDGLPNWYEYLIGTNLSEVSEATFSGYFSIDFDNGVIPQAIATEGGEWFIRDDYFGNSGFDLRAPAATLDNDLPSITFYANLNGEGRLEFSMRTDNSYYSDNNDILKVYVNDVEVTDLSDYSVRYIDGNVLGSGLKKIRFELQVPSYNWNVTDEQLILDDIKYVQYIGPDYDGDGITDDSDNCEYDYNPTQSDSDNDGLGDACDYYNEQDADNDGVSDDWDNCPSTPNSNQSDYDWDDLGDACDDDIDGDGLSNDIESELGRDPKYRESKWHDSDGDTVSDWIEVALETNPGAVDIFETIVLSSYFPLGDITRTYDHEYYNDITLTMKSLGNHQYLESNSEDSCTQLLESRVDGLYLLTVSCPEEGYRTEYTDYLILPTEMTMGETITISPTHVVYKDDKQIDRYSYSFDLTLINTGNSIVKDTKYETVSFIYNGNLDSFEIYGKDAGLLTSQSQELASINIDIKENWQEAAAEEITTPEEAPAASSGKSSGGAINLFWLLIAGVAVISRRRLMIQ
jgi:hypothetical protein